MTRIINSSSRTTSAPVNPCRSHRNHRQISPRRRLLRNLRVPQRLFKGDLSRDSSRPVEEAGILAESGLCGCARCVLVIPRYQRPAEQRATKRRRADCAHFASLDGLSWRKMGPVSLDSLVDTFRIAITMTSLQGSSSFPLTRRALPLKPRFRNSPCR